MAVPVEAKEALSLGPQAPFRGTYVAAYPGDGTP